MLADLGPDLPGRDGPLPDNGPSDAQRQDGPSDGPSDGPFDSGFPAPDGSDVADIPSLEDLPGDTGPDRPDAGGADGEVDSDAGRLDVPDGSGDVPRGDALPPPDHGDADPAAPEAGDAPDAPSVPPLVIDYVPRNPASGANVPSTGRASRIDYAFGEGRPASPMAMCLAQVLEGGAAWRCMVPTLPLNARTVTFLYVVVPDACGGDTDIPMCPADWPRHWTITWLGGVYTAASTVPFDGGMVDAFMVVDRSTCQEATGYNNPCIRFRLPR